MKIKSCRSCNSTSLKKVFDLGNQKLTGVFLKKKDQQKAQVLDFAQSQPTAPRQESETHENDARLFPRMPRTGAYLNATSC